VQEGPLWERKRRKNQGKFSRNWEPRLSRVGRSQAKKRGKQMVELGICQGILQILSLAESNKFGA
jgi:hypothetical protein